MNKENLENILKKHRDHPWYFIAPGGNWGDQLIYAGAEKLARTLGIHWTHLTYEDLAHTKLPVGAYIYIHGNGGFNQWGSQRAFFTLQFALKTPQAFVIQGPVSCEINPEVAKKILAIFDDSVATELHFFVREATSADFLKTNLPPSIHLYLDHDTAFYLTKNDLLALMSLEQFPKDRYNLFVIRKDNESPSTHMPGDKHAVILDPAYYAISFSHWLRIHSYAHRIVSNRLHSAILGALLEKPVTLLPGSYHKNHSLWEYSLKKYGVKWQENLSNMTSQEAFLTALVKQLPSYFRNSWKINRGLLYLRGVPYQ